MPSTPSTLETYGFDLLDDHFDQNDMSKFGDSYAKVIERRERRWEKVDFSSQPKSRKMKRFVRKGIPPAFRADFWMKVTGVDKKMEAEPKRFQTLLEVELSNDVKNIIETDVPRTYPENSFFSASNKEGNLSSVLSNVLRAFAASMPEIGYCQGLNFVAAEILLVVRDDAKAFWLLEHLIKEVVPSGYYMPSMIALKRDCDVLSRLVREKMPKLADLLDGEGISFVVICTKWFICLFCDTLPFETSLRILDCLFYEGDKILFRVSLALLKLNEKQLENCHTFPELLTSIQNMVVSENTLFCHEFMKNVFEVTGSLPRKKIDKLRNDSSQTKQIETNVPA